MKKLIFALIAMATISFASCAGNANNQEATEEEAVEITIDSVCPEEAENDTIALQDSIEGEQPAEAVETEVQE